MKKELEFYECQHLKRWLAVFFMVVISGSFIYGCILLLVTEMKLWGNNPMSDIMIIVVTVITILVTASFFFLRVDTVINKEGVWVRVFPFRRRFKLTPWDNISEYVVRKKNLIGDKRGIGVKLVRNRVGNRIQMVRQTTYNLSGNYVLELTLINNKKISIGTKMPEELTAFLEKLDAERKQK
ncbi:MAG: hypothetical protein LBI82_03600 [Dysgonamonadaceae bacterium]|jgi:hypothetical protein|nr:hypothetical protein [Dysgonamonadaceae bacterium]